MSQKMFSLFTRNETNKQKKGLKKKPTSKQMTTQTVTDILKKFDDEMERGVQSTVWLALAENSFECACIFPVTPKI